jgi:prolipoprotein diacylglyceryltransferase
MPQALYPEQRDCLMQTLYLGPLTVSVYTASVILAGLLGLLALWLLSRSYNIDGGLALDAALVAILIGIAAGRAEVIWTNLDYFRERPALLLDLQQGGLGQRSLTVTAVAAYIAIVASRRGQWRSYLNAIAPALALAAAIAWAGAGLSGQAAGAPWQGHWALALPDKYGTVAPRLPLQFIMAGAHLTLAILVLLLNRVGAHSSAPLAPGLGLFLWGAATSALSALLSNFSAEAALFIGVIPRPVAADIALTVAWLVAAFVLPRPTEGIAQPEPTPSPDEKGVGAHSSAPGSPPKPTLPASETESDH